MALHWEWNDRIGEVTDERGYTSNIYRGNSFMIACHQWEENGEKYYSLAWFFADKAHLKNCLGLTKGYEPINYDWVSFRLDTKYKETAEFVAAVAKAKLKLKIELY